ncbi:MAG: tetratricopeptide repeat protein [Phycisphaerales bacterium]|nr:MAG: tetratricopeptide repeat protein [Phycisphaerales bacterium]
MKAEHRHELKTNELADWIVHFPQWARENRTTIIIVVAVVVVAAALYFWRDYDKNVVQVRRQLALTSLVNQLPVNKMRILQSHSQGRDDSFILLSLAGDLQTFAQEAKDDRMAALALIKQAQAVRTELHYRAGAVSDQELIEQTSKAKASYTEAIRKASDCPSLLAIARFGLGLCEEELGDFDKAEQTYRDIVADPGLDGTAAKAAAEHRLGTMTDYKTNVVFRPAPTPQILTTLTSPLETKPSDVNLPTDANLLPDANSPTDTNLPIGIELGPAAPDSTPEVLEPNSSDK